MCDFHHNQGVSEKAGSVKNTDAADQSKKSAYQRGKGYIDYVAYKRSGEAVFSLSGNHQRQQRNVKLFHQTSANGFVVSGAGIDT